MSNAPAPTALAASLADRIAESWVERQLESGAFPDAIAERFGLRGRDTYGEAMLGGALLLSGRRTAESRLALSGLRAIDYAIRTRRGFAPKRLPSRVARLVPRFRGGMYPFSMIGIVDSWIECDEFSAFESEIDPRIVRDIRCEIDSAGPLQTRLIDRHRDRNRTFLEMLLVKSLDCVSSLHPGAAGIDASIDTWCDLTLAESGSNGDGFPAALLSDVPDQPQAYHAFTTGNLARLIRRSAPGSGPKLEELLRRAVRASRLLASPDGDLAWAGRTTMLAWTLPFAAYAALVAANTPDCDPAEASANRGFAADLLERLRGEYVIEPQASGEPSLALVPALSDPAGAGQGVIDEYAAEVSYIGTTLLGLEWVAAEPAGTHRESSPTPIQGLLRVGSTEPVLGSVRSEDLWLGLRGQRSTERTDPRYDLGPVAAKERTESGWRWLLPPRPRLVPPDMRSWIQIRRGGELVLPISDSTESVDGGVEQRISFPNDGDSSTDHLSLQYAPSPASGLRISIQGPRPRLQLVFWLPGDRMEPASDGLLLGKVLMRYSDQPSVNRGDLVSSSTHAELTTFVLLFEPGDRPLTLDLLTAQSEPRSRGSWR